MSNFEYIVIQAQAGTVVYHGIKEAAQLALEENVVVHYVHNGKTYVVNPSAIMEFVNKENE